MDNIMNDFLSKFNSILDDVGTLPEKEQKEILKEIGAKLARIRHPENYESKRKVPCVCGAKQLRTMRGHYVYYVSCPKCPKIGPEGKTELEASKLWNEMIEKETKSEQK